MPARPQPVRHFGDLDRACTEALLYFAAVLADRTQLLKMYARCWLGNLLVGVTGFEPATSSSRTKRATKLRHTP